MGKSDSTVVASSVASLHTEDAAMEHKNAVWTQARQAENAEWSARQVNLDTVLRPQG